LPEFKSAALQMNGKEVFKFQILEETEITLFSFVRWERDQRQRAVENGIGEQWRIVFISRQAQGSAAQPRAH
jgi:hypothetical protein